MNKFDFQLLRKKLTQCKIIKMKIVSDSMSPLIKVGDIIKIENYEKLKLFDIIVFREFDRLTCHYIIQTNPKILTTSIKHMKNIDFPINEDQILGTVVNYKLSIFTKIKFLISKL